MAGEEGALVGFLGLRKAKWRHADPAVRLAGVAELTYDQQALFAKLAGEDADGRVRLAAARRINDQTALQRLLQAADPEVARLARERLAGVAVKLALERPFGEVGAMLGTIADQKSLAELSLSAKDAQVREAALARLLALPEPSPALLVMVAVQDAAGAFGLRAVAKLDRRGLLKDVARKAKHPGVQAAALARAEALEADSGKPTSEQLRKGRLKALEALAAQVARLAVTSDQERAASEWTSLEARRVAALAEFSALPLDDAARALDERLQRGHREFTARRAAERADRDAALAVRERFLATLTGEAVASDVAARRVELNAAWTALGTLDGPEARAFAARFAQELARICPAPVAADPAHDAGAGAAAPRGDNLDEAARSELQALNEESAALAAKEGLQHGDDFRDVIDRFRVLHKRWMSLSAPLPERHPLRAGFMDAYGRFKERQRTWRDERSAQAAERVTRLTALAVEAEALAAQPPGEAELRPRFDRLRQLQAEWKAVGAVRLELIKAVRTRFRAACDEAYKPVKALQEAEDWARFAQFAKAEELAAAVEALSAVEDLAAVSQHVRRAQQDWKTLGPLPRDKRESAWHRFRTACDAQYERLKPYFAELDAARAANLERKRALLAEVGQLAGQAPIGLAGSPADRLAKKAAAERIKAIQQEWRGVGPVPREHDQELWTAFRAACDGFFGQHRAEISEQHQEFTANLERKQALCATAEALAAEAEAGAADPGKAQPGSEVMRRIKDVQAAWKTIGHVPREHVETVWTRFRTACDRVYATLKEHIAALEAERQENLAKKRALLAEAEELLAHENAHWFKDDFRDLQRQYREIGYVPRENMDELAQRFREVFDKAMALEGR